MKEIESFLKDKIKEFYICQNEYEIYIFIKNIKNYKISNFKSYVSNLVDWNITIHYLDFDINFIKYKQLTTKKVFKNGNFIKKSKIKKDKKTSKPFQSKNKMKLWSKKRRLEHYRPILENIGAVLKSEGVYLLKNHLCFPTKLKARHKKTNEICPLDEFLKL